MYIYIHIIAQQYTLTAARANIHILHSVTPGKKSSYTQSMSDHIAVALHACLFPACHDDFVFMAASVCLQHLSRFWPVGASDCSPHASPSGAFSSRHHDYLHFVLLSACWTGQLGCLPLCCPLYACRRSIKIGCLPYRAITQSNVGTIFVFVLDGTAFLLTKMLWVLILVFFCNMMNYYHCVVFIFSTVSAFFCPSPSSFYFV